MCQQKKIEPGNLELNSNSLNNQSQNAQLTIIEDTSTIYNQADDSCIPLPQRVKETASTWLKILTGQSSSSNSIQLYSRLKEKSD